MQNKSEAARIASAIDLKINALAVAYSAIESGGNAAPARELLHAICKPLETAEVKIDVSADLGLAITSQQTAPIGITVNEAVCNAIKHGFPDGETGTVEVSLLRKSSASYELIVSNDGRPLTAGPRRKRGGKGSLFIENLVRQLGGTVTLKDREPRGVILTVSVPTR